MGHYGALPPKFAEVSPRFFTPGYATIVSAIVASVFYAVMRFISEDVLWDTITTLGMMICFYYGITAFACVWYFRKQWFDSTRNVFFTFLFPLIGGVILAFLFVTTLIDSMDPDYGSGSNIGGLGLVFILGVVVIGVGIVIMIWQAIKRPAFFRGETLSLEAPASLRRAARVTGRLDLPANGELMSDYTVVNPATGETLADIPTSRRMPSSSRRSRRRMPPARAGRTHPASPSARRCSAGSRNCTASAATSSPRSSCARWASRSRPPSARSTSPPTSPSSTPTTPSRS